MSSGWQLLVIALWLVVIVQGGLILLLYRQFGLDYLGRSEARSRDGLPLRSAAPSWELLDENGVVQSSTALRGDPLLLVFADLSCPPCRKLLPELEEFATQHPGIIVKIVGSSDAEDNRQMIERYTPSISVLTQIGTEVSDLYRVTATPFLYLIDEAGEIREKGIVNFRAQIEEKLMALKARAGEEVLV